MRETYKSIQRNIPRNMRIDSLKVVMQVIQYRYHFGFEKTMGHLEDILIDVEELPKPCWKLAFMETGEEE